MLNTKRVFSSTSILYDLKETERERQRGEKKSTSEKHTLTANTSSKVTNVSYGGNKN